MNFLSSFFRKGSLESLVQISEQISFVFEADGKSDKCVGDAENLSLIFGHGSVGHDRGVFSKRFKASERFGKGEDLRIKLA